MPEATAYAKFRANRASILDAAIEKQARVIVRRRGAKDVAVIPADESAGLMETAHLLRSPKNAARLMAALRSAEKGADAGRRSRNCGGSSVLSGRVERALEFHTQFRDDLRFWVETNRSVAPSVLHLVGAVAREPFEGIGKPERLGYHLEGCWSRRIIQERRLVYRVGVDRIDFLQARYHY
jgi:toxin YoeB